MGTVMFGDGLMMLAKLMLEWGIISIGAVVVGVGIIVVIRRFLKNPLGNSQHDAGFSLSDLRAMRDRGEISSEEYEQTRARVIAKVKGGSNKPNPPPGLGQPGQDSLEPKDSDGEELGA